MVTTQVYVVTVAQSFHFLPTGDTLERLSGVPHSFLFINNTHLNLNDFLYLHVRSLSRLMKG